ncbi:alkaline phosphatase family protein [Natribaculum luteum]|uniref:Alkaline phosphatase family protein n=1 Tax=Natribaculum luteum TaxID=1586232 RepID=A0ABD5NY62_9EURY|nr:alkaline phosphatase family protein [Natribaculum luteum]
MKTIVLGFDALDFRYLDKFEEALPNISALRERGVEAPLKSTHPPWTGSAWPSMYTGSDPSYHGVYGFFSYDDYPDERNHVSRSDVRQPAIWDYLSSQGQEVIVMNVPVTHPVEPINGILIPGYLAPEDEPGHPRGIRKELTEAIGEKYTIYSNDEISSNLDDKFNGYLDLIDQRRRAAVTLLEQYKWELAIIQVQKTDAVFHHYEKKDRFREIYQAADKLVGDVLDSVSEDVNVVLCSDHGIGPVTGYQVHVNEILRENNYIETIDDGGQSMPLIDKAALTSSEGQVEDSGKEHGKIEKALLLGQEIASQLGIEPVDIYATAERVGLGTALVKLAPDSLRKTAASESINWRESRAYCSKGSRMGIRINLAGREPNGTVSPSEYEAVRDELIALLSKIETPDGERVFEFVCRREDIYDGPFLEDAPDICFLPNKMNHTVSHALYGRKFIPVEKYDHKLEGTFVGAGPGFSAETALGPLSLTDVAPIIMGLLNQSIPSRMTGSLPEDLLTNQPDRADYGTITYGTRVSKSPNDDEKVTERLEDLGYL